MTPRVLVVAGSDSGGGAGIQADIKTVMALGGHAMTAITAITAQNTLGVTDIMPVPADMVAAQMTSVLTDIGADAVKVGMLGSVETAHRVAASIAAGCAGIPVVADPVLVASSGDSLAGDDVVAAMAGLFGLATIVTPNLPELARLTGLPVAREEERIAAARALAARSGAAVLAKGGHGESATLVDILVSRDGDVRHWASPRIDSRSTHGTGCTLASAIATELGRGRALADAVTVARAFVRDAILAAPGLGGGHGPMGHGLAPDLALDQVTLPLADYDASTAFYRTLGLRQIVAAAPRYAQFEAPNGATLSIEAGGTAGDAVIYFECADLDTIVARLAAAGLAFAHAPRDERCGWREARLDDPAGNRLCLFRAGPMRRFPPWRLPD